MCRLPRFPAIPNAPASTIARAEVTDRISIRVVRNLPAAQQGVSRTPRSQDRRVARKNLARTRMTHDVPPAMSIISAASATSATLIGLRARNVIIAGVSPMPSASLVRVAVRNVVTQQTFEFDARRDGGGGALIQEWQP